MQKLSIIMMGALVSTLSFARVITKPSTVEEMSKSKNKTIQLIANATRDYKKEMEKIEKSNLSEEKKEKERHKIYHRNTLKLEVPHPKGVSSLGHKEISIFLYPPIDKVQKFTTPQGGTEWSYKFMKSDEEVSAHLATIGDKVLYSGKDKYYTYPPKSLLEVHKYAVTSYGEATDFFLKGGNRYKVPEGDLKHFKCAKEIHSFVKSNTITQDLGKKINVPYNAQFGFSIEGKDNTIFSYGDKVKAVSNSSLKNYEVDFADSSGILTSGKYNMPHKKFERLDHDESYVKNQSVEDRMINILTEATDRFTTKGKEYNFPPQMSYQGGLVNLMATDACSFLDKNQRCKLEEKMKKFYVGTHAIKHMDKSSCDYESNFSQKQQPKIKKE